MSLLVFYPNLGRGATIRDLYEAAVNAYTQRQYDHAIELYQEITKAAPQFAPAYIGLGLALKAKGADIEEVLYYYKTATEKDSTNAQALEQLGRLYYSINRLDKAEVCFQKALKIDPHMTNAKLSLAWIGLVGKKPNPPRAIIYFQDVLKSSPTPNAYFGLGIAYFADNQREKALDMITQLKGMGQDDLAGKLEKAVRENQKVILDENTPSAQKL
ncbi:MAG: tetratricopeptide repeat protein [Candidatus Omnitrophica bacterium]|nr:tetratricopeptide repeat protein [Candidatus Omnitrophota bacterium]